MIRILSEAFDKAATFPEPMQKQIALQLLEELDAELKWDQTLKGSQHQLAIMANKALEDYKTGQGKAVGFDEL